MQEFAELLKAVAAVLKAIAWPAALLVVLFALRAEMSAIGTAFARKIERASKFKVTRSGFELVDEIVRRSVAGIGADRAAGSEQQEFDQLAEAYDRLSIANPEARIAERRRLADRLGQLAVSLASSRQALADSGSEGRLVALATAIVLKPQARDLAVLERAAQRAGFNFTRYRIVLALISILSRSAATATVLRRASAILLEAEHRPAVGTDPSLQRLIDKTRDAIADFAGGAEILNETGVVAHG